MKTPREILLATHRPIEPKLDSLRSEVLAQISAPSARRSETAKAGARAPTEQVWRGVLRMFRWHLAGLASAWVMIAALRFSSGAAGTAQPVPARPVVASHSIIFSLRENRRQILESDDDSNFPAFGKRKTIPESRHSRLRVNQA
jgi:hypothetical protein